MAKQLFYFILFLCSFFVSPHLPSEEIADGISYKRIAKEGPLIIHILEVDPHKVYIDLVLAKGYPMQLQTVSEIAKQHGAIAAINSGFFREEGEYAGTASGALKVQGRWISTSEKIRSAIGWTAKKNELLLDRISTKTWIRSPLFTFPVSSLNQPFSEDKAIVYKQPYFPSTLAKGSLQEIITDSRNKVRNFLKTVNNTIPVEGMVVAIGENYPNKLPPLSLKDKLSLSVDVVPYLQPSAAPAWQDVDYLVGGAAMLISRGQCITDQSAENVRSSFLLHRHPRTAIGILENAHWVFVVVEGRQPTTSVGMTMEELSTFMLELQCKDAINLDGGGSSTMFIQSQVVNATSGDDPHDGVLRNISTTPSMERPVSDSIIIRTRK